MSQQRHLIVFARAPRIGQVKTRLARDIGTIDAWRFYRQTLRTLLRSLSRPGRWTSWIAVSPDTAADGSTDWPRPWQALPQGPGDLGQRMTRVLRRLPPGPAVIVGSDVPSLSPDNITRAFAALAGADIVLGPSPDGGYWLIGVAPRHRRRALFANVRWSTRHAFSDTLINVCDLNLVALDLLEDVDDGPSFRRWRQRHRRAEIDVSGRSSDQ